MAWVRLDDHFPDHPKAEQAGDSACWLYVCGLAYCNRLRTDGFIPEARVPKLSGQAKPMRLAERLVEAGLWDREPGGFSVHDYLEYQPSAAELKEQSIKRAESGRRGGQAKAKQSAKQVAKQTAGKSQANDVAKSKPVPVPVPLLPDGSNDPSSSSSDDIGAVFDAWIQSTGRTGQTRLDPKRRRLIRNALASYPAEDVLDAVRGWSKSPHHRGENDQATTYNDLGLLLRDSAHIERFRDLERGQSNGPPREGGPSKGLSGEGWWVENMGGLRESQGGAP